MQLFEKLGEAEPKRKDFICIGPKGNIKGETTCNAALERMCERNSLPKIGMHDLRHTYATVLKKNDISLKAISVCMGHNGTGVTKDVYINLPEEIYDCEKVIGNFIIDILPQTDFVFDIQISEKDLLELLPQKVYNIVG